MTTAIEVVDAAWRRGLRPDPAMTISTWADQHRRLSQRASAEPGPWQTSRTPYLKDIMDALSPSSPIEQVVFQKGAQVGGTEAGNNWLGFIIDMAPGPTMMVLPTVETAKRASKQRIDALIEESPRLRDKVRPARERDSGNTVLQKDFPGGTLIMTGANSAVGLRSMPVRNLFLDELDGYPADADGEGDPVNLAIKRTATFARRKVIMVSTPSVEGASRIQDAFEATDRREFFVPCLGCGTYQTLKFEQLRWTSINRAPAHAAYECEACGALHENADKARMLPAGEWRATADSAHPRTVGFHLSALYSPPGWVSWGELAQESIEAEKSAERNKTFVNTVLGRTYLEADEAPDWERLARMAGAHDKGTVPAGAAILTAGADIQGDRIEAEVVAWGRRRESWSVDYRIFNGDPSQDEVWQAFESFVLSRFPTAAGGELEVSRVAIDAGYRTADVMAWIAHQAGDRVMAVQGRDNLTAPIGAPVAVDVNTRTGKRIPHGGRLWPVGSSVLKSRLYSWLSQDPPRDGEDTPIGLCHFPAFDDRYFKMLTAERRVKRKNRQGFVRLEWQKIRERNEALDCRVYAMAAAETLKLDRWTEADWQAAEAATQDTTRHAPAAKPRVRRSSWLS